MRVWDVHPGYLSRQSLLGQHVEIHAIFSVLCGRRKGYSRHPETLRWESHLDSLAACHDLTVKEMALRGHNHASPIKVDEITRERNSEKLQYVDKPARQFDLLQLKYLQKRQCGRIPLPNNGSAFWSHYKYSVMGRGYRYYQEIKQFLNQHKDDPIGQSDELIEQILFYMKKVPTEKSLLNVTDHLWGYFMQVSSAAEHEIFSELKNPCVQLDYLYSLAQKYKQTDLLHSTIFADFNPYFPQAAFTAF